MACWLFFYTLILVRFGGRRIFGKNTSFDIVLGVILGSIMSRALTANASFLPTIAAATALVILHWLMAKLAQRSKSFGYLIKGTEVQLVKDGCIIPEALNHANLTEHDLHEAIRSNGGAIQVQNIKEAYLERSGSISVVLR